MDKKKCCHYPVVPVPWLSFTATVSPLCSFDTPEISGARLQVIVIPETVGHQSTKLGEKNMKGGENKKQKLPYSTWKNWPKESWWLEKLVRDQFGFQWHPFPSIRATHGTSARGWHTNHAKHLQCESDAWQHGTVSERQVWSLINETKGTFDSIEIMFQICTGESKDASSFCWSFFDIQRNKMHHKESADGDP